MSIAVEALQALDRLSVGDTLIAAVVAALVCFAGPLVHELGHLVPARLLCRSGRVALFPFRALGGFRAWIVVFAIELHDNHLRRVSIGKAAAVLAGGPVADLMLICWCTLAWGWFRESIGTGIALGGAARAAVWLLNLLPIPALNNDSARLVQFVLARSASRAESRSKLAP